MNPVLERILTTGLVMDGTKEIPVRAEMDGDGRALITASFRAARPKTSVEIGLAMGVSALVACDTLAENGDGAVHIVMDPFQAYYNDVGLANIRAAGYQHLVQFHRDSSEHVLPRLYDQETRIQAAIVDGRHNFDQVLVEFFFINKMLDVGGIVVFDDAHFPGLMPLMRHIATYPAYRRFAPGAGTPALAGRLRRVVARTTGLLARPWDNPRAMAFQKIDNDDRPNPWHVPF